MKLKAIPFAASVLALSTAFAGAQTTQAEPGTTATTEAPMQHDGMHHDGMHGDMHHGGMMMGNSGVATEDNYASMISADELLGADIYSVAEEVSDEDWNATPSYDAVSDDWNDIGEVDDIVMSPDGKLVGLAVETGGWLDIGDDTVLLSLKDVRFVKDGDDFSVVTRLTQDELEAKPQLDESWLGGMK
ncbi:PRC-barrel domain-containing protein [Falsirhodobacter algicola]|uniref:PRC-barrel domain-containing protein n=1 Tax=Falsirhodobacter algicola TaxID=2692330 RepID=A0A8J8MV56_9RHOB|nr:PRC-barrel domain-containing protein [Falsirhodobacter algicola]QUS37292.1 hypothetical protein GR316_12995 [Falsirhodobacter algicola]